MPQGIAVPALGDGPAGFLEVQSRCSVQQCLNGGKKSDGFKIYFKVSEQKLDEVWICYFILDCKQPPNHKPK